MAPLELSRRELFSTFLGAGAAAALGACRGSAPGPTFSGEIVGANASFGHLLRDGGGRLEPGQPPARVGVAIVGGGVAGLSAAWCLARAGVEDFRIYELEEEAGGTARAGQNAVSRYPWGAHYLPVPLPHARAAIALLAEMGVARALPDGSVEYEETQLCRAPQERLFIADRFYEGLWPGPIATEEDRRQVAVFDAEVKRWAELKDGQGRRAFAVPCAYGSGDADVAALDRISMADWLAERKLGSPRLRWFLEYACRDDFGARLPETSAWAGLHYFASRVEGGKSAELLTWPEGNGRLVAHLARSAKGRVVPGAGAVEVRPSAQGVELRYLVPRRGRVESVIADQVILALPRAFASRLLASERDRPPPFVERFQVGSWLVANLTLKGRPRERGFPLAWDNVLYGSESLGYVVATHQTDPGACLEREGEACARRAPEAGRSVWTWYLPMTDADPKAGRAKLLGLDWRQAAELCVADLTRAHPDIARWIERLDVMRWGHAMIRPAPGFAFGPWRKEAARPQGSVFFAHSDLSGLALFEEAQYQGVRAAEEVLAARRIRFESLL
ncbi:MAG TPA: FAD-dependent oxidoreductase [Myxococcales bacterium]|nr:FAD-dependent oxidoreductase [Myxococcales bacterium]